MTYAEYLKSIGACEEAIEESQNKTAQQVWDTCDRGDWMLWLAAKLSGESGSEEKKQLVLTSCKCARLSLKYIPKKENRPLQVIETTEKWAKGENGITLNDVRNAAAATYPAYAYTAAAYTAYLVYAAEAYIANYATYVAVTAAYTAYEAAKKQSSPAVAKKQILKQCADIVREYYTLSPAIEIIGQIEQSPVRR
jgi:hypothetical protein